MSIRSLYEHDDDNDKTKQGNTKRFVAPGSYVKIFECQSNLCQAWEPNSATTFCGQSQKQASAQGHNDNSNNKA